MKILILDGNPFSENTAFPDYLSELKQKVNPGNQLEIVQLCALDLKSCTGCWNCWWKTPGHCAVKDDAENILKKVIESDLMIFASPVIAGFTSALLKMITDRFVILALPYIKMVQNESHHYMRYEKTPKLAVLLQKEELTDAEDIEIIGDIYDRIALNFSSKIEFVKCIDEHKAEEVAHVISTL